MWLGCFERNLEENAVPANLATVTAGSYPEFLAERRKLIAFHSDLLRPALSDCDPIGLEAGGEVAVVFLDVKVGRRAAASPPGRDAPALADPAQLADVKSATAKL
jgi:hypothetical protein